MKVYALKKKGRMKFSYFSKDLDSLDKRINDSYWGWRGCQSRSAPEEEKSLEIYIADSEKVLLTIETLPDDSSDN